MSDAVRIHVKWDTSTDEHPEGDPSANVPETVDVPADVLAKYAPATGADYIADVLTDAFGWCVIDWRVL